MVVLSALAYGLAGLGYGLIRFFQGLTASAGAVSMADHLDQAMIWEISNYQGARGQVESAYGYLDHVLTPIGAAVGIGMAIYLTLRLPWPLRLLSITLPVVAGVAEIIVRATNLHMLIAGQATAEGMRTATYVGWAQIGADIGQLALTFAACLFCWPHRRRLALAMAVFGIFPPIFWSNGFNGGMIGWLWLPAMALASREALAPPSQTMPPIETFA